MSWEPKGNIWLETRPWSVCSYLWGAFPPLFETVPRSRWCCPVRVPISPFRPVCKTSSPPPMKPVGERSSLTWWSRAPTQPNWRVPPPLTRFPWCTPPTEVTRDDDRAVLPVRSPGGDDRVPGVGRVVALGRPGADGGGRRLRG